MRWPRLIETLALGATLVTGCAPSPSPAAPNQPTVVRVIDGDTVIVSFAGHEESLRLIGVDTPEIAHGGRPADCFGQEAADRARDLLPPGTAVTVARDVETRDVYGRVLAYVAVDGLVVNLQLVREGLAQAMPIAPNDALSAELAAAERSARRDEVGLWSECDVVS